MASRCQVDEVKAAPVATHGSSCYISMNSHTFEYLQFPEHATCFPILIFSSYYRWGEKESQKEETEFLRSY